jgi:hypothetical protein
LAGGSTYRTLVARVAVLETKRSGADGMVVALTQSVGFLLGVVATHSAAANVIDSLGDHFTRECDRLAASGKFDDNFLSEYKFTVETVTGTAKAMATAMKNRREAGGI